MKTPKTTLWKRSEQRDILSFRFFCFPSSRFNSLLLRHLVKRVNERKRWQIDTHIHTRWSYLYSFDSYWFFSSWFFSLKSQYERLILSLSINTLLSFGIISISLSRTKLLFSRLITDRSIEKCQLTGQEESEKNFLVFLSVCLKTSRPPFVVGHSIPISSNSAPLDDKTTRKLTQIWLPTVEDERRKMTLMI